jgi:hypothetical protein
MELSDAPEKIPSDRGSIQSLNHYATPGPNNHNTNNKIIFGQLLSTLLLSNFLLKEPKISFPSYKSLSVRIYKGAFAICFKAHASKFFCH